MLPNKIGRYQIKAELGRGGMSTVYLAHDPHFERDVAVKLLPHELLHHGNFRRRFDREAKIVASLDHPAIVPVYDFGEQDGQPFLVMRFMAGGALTDRLKQGPISIQKASRIISRLAPALDEVHRKGVIHRDLKPSNILFDQRNDPFISDFGTAKFTFEHTKLTETGGAVGTPAYMSPEQIQGEAALNGRSDIYTLGTILFEMLTGQHPFQTNTPIGLAVKHIFEPVPNLQDMMPDLPPSCQALIARAMAKDPADRYPSAAELAKALREVAQNTDEETIRPLPETTAARNGRYALIIHVDTFDDKKLARLQPPAADVKKLSAALRNPQIGGFTDVTITTNQSGDAIRKSISRFFTGKRPEDLLMVYYAGHAMLDGNGSIYFAAKNSDHTLIRATGVSGAFLADEMDNCKAPKQILVLDCLFSKLLLPDKQNGRQLPAILGKAIDTGASFTRHDRDRLILSASDSVHYIWQENGISGSPQPSRFTEFLIDGLESGGADLDNDGVVTLNELFDYITDRTNSGGKTTNGAVQQPRKWIDDTQNRVVLAHNPFAPAAKPSAVPAASQNKSKWLPTPPRKTPSAWLELTRQRLMWIGTFILMSVFIIVGGRGSISNGRSTAAAQAVFPTHTRTPAPITPSATAPPATQISHSAKTATRTPSPTATPLPSPEPAATETAVPAETAIPQPPATILLPSSLFASPAVDAPEVAIVDIGELVTVLGRSENGHWLYVLNEDAAAGYIFGERVNWTGEFDALPVVPDGNGRPAAACTGGECALLTIDLYPLPGSRCADGVGYRTIYIQGQGGNGRYTYYWNGEKVAGPVDKEGFGFEVNNLSGSQVIGTGKVVSGDGQTAEKGLFITDFGCNE